LKTEASRLLQQKAEHEKHLKTIGVELLRIEAGLEALGARAPKPKASKPSANREVVRESVRACFATQDIFQRDELTEAVGKCLKEAGYSRIGMALRLKEVLAENILTQEADGFRLRTQHEPTGSVLQQ
jgi:hypothetical protein